jgi:hypothetical protein
MPVSNRHFEKVEQLMSLAERFKACIKTATSIVLPEEIAYHPGYNTMDRIIDTYRPILRIVQMLIDVDFEEKLWQDLQLKSEVFRDGQAYEPGPLFLQAIVSSCTKNGKLDCRKSLTVTDLINWVYENHHKNHNAYQASQLLKEYGFKVRRSGGQNRLYIESVMQLIRVCRLASIEDEVIERTEKEIKDAQQERDNSDNK